MINLDDSVEDLVWKYPKLNAFLMRRGIRCMLCGEPFWGSLGDLIKSSDLDAEKIIKEINEEFFSE